MSVVFSGSLSGTFTSNGNNQFIQIPTNLDWMWVYNYTNLAAGAAASTNVQYYWQNGMPNTQGLFYGYSSGSAFITGSLAAGNGFTFINSTNTNPGPLITATGVTNANPPTITMASTAGFFVGTIVRVYNFPGALELGGLDFTVTAVTANTSITLGYMSQVTASSSGGNVAIVPFVPYFYPSTRYISAITQAAQAVVTLTVTHNYSVGQSIRFDIPAAYGMSQLNGIQATIVAVNTTNNTITVDVNTTGFTAFAFPLSAAVPFTPATVVPVGEDTASAIYYNQNILADSTYNSGYIGMMLAGGANNPGGANGNVMYWVAGKSFNGV